MVILCKTFRKNVPPDIKAWNVKHTAMQTGNFLKTFKCIMKPQLEIMKMTTSLKMLLPTAEKTYVSP